MRRYSKVLLIVSLIVGGSSLASATSTDLFKLPGSLWGRFDQRLNSTSDTTGQTRNGRFMVTVEQGVQLRAFPHITAYVSGNFYQPLAQPTDRYLSFGAKNTTLLPRLSFGIERQDSTVFNLNVPVSSRWVVFVSTYLDWDASKLLQR